MRVAFSEIAFESLELLVDNLDSLDSAVLEELNEKERETFEFLRSRLIALYERSEIKDESGDEEEDEEEQEIRGGEGNDN